MPLSEGVASSKQFSREAKERYINMARLSRQTS